MARVLIIDDSDDFREMVALFASAAGHDVLQAPHGGVALEMLRKHRVDVVLLDMMMPEVDGLTFLKRLPIECAPPLPQIVALSGFPAHREEALRLGTRTFVQKPTSPDVLLAALNAAVSRAPVPPGVYERSGEDVAAARLASGRATEELVGSIDLSRSPETIASLQLLTAWLPRFYGFGSALVATLHGQTLRVEAESGGEIVIGSEYDRRASFCDEMLDAGSTLTLEDALSHPCAHFSAHEAVTHRGVRFYLGAPVTTRDAVPLGVICLYSLDPHPIVLEDIRLFDELGRDVANLFSQISAGKPTLEGPIDAVGLFRERLERHLLAVLLRRAARLRARCVVGTVAGDDAKGWRPLVRAAYTDLRETALAFVSKAPDSILIMAGPHAEDSKANAVEAFSLWRRGHSLFDPPLVDVPPETEEAYAEGTRRTSHVD